MIYIVFYYDIYVKKDQNPVSNYNMPFNIFVSKYEIYSAYRKLFLHIPNDFVINIEGE